MSPELASIFDRTGLAELMAAARGREGVPIGMADGVVHSHHPHLAHAEIRDARARRQARSDIAAPPSCARPGSPSCTHGTFVAGLLVGLAPTAQLQPEGDHDETTVSGICPASPLLTYPLFCEADELRQCPSVRPSDLAHAIDALVDDGARVINLSVGTAAADSPSSAALDRAFDHARERGVLIIAAAGNAGKHDGATLFRHPWVIPVAACDGQGELLSTSNRGGDIDKYGLLAPGEGWPRPRPDGGTSKLTGTSVASAVASGAAALLWSLNPQANADDIRTALLTAHEQRHEGPPAHGPPLLDLRHSMAHLDAQRVRLAPPKEPEMTSDTQLNNQPFGRPPSGATEPAADITAPSPPVAPASADFGQPAEPPTATIVPQSCACQMTAAGYAYSAGTLSIRFPDEGTQKEFDARARTLGKSPTRDQYAIFKESMYLANRVCWVLSLDGKEIAILLPKTERETDQLVAALDPQITNTQLVVLGELGPRAPASLCNGLEVPLIGSTDFCWFTQDKLAGEIQKQLTIDPSATDREIDAATSELWRALGVWTAPGLDDTQRAKNFVGLRTLDIFGKTIELSRKSGGEFWFVDLEDSTATTPAGREVTTITFNFQAANGRKQAYRLEIDVTGLYPFETGALELA